MNKELVITAILSAINLIVGEMESLCNENLQDEYKSTLQDLYAALKELESSHHG